MIIITVLKILLVIGIIFALYFLGYSTGYDHGLDDGWADGEEFFHRNGCLDCPFYKAARIWLDEFEWSYGEHEKRVNKEKGGIDFDLLSRDLNKEIELMGFTEDYEYDDSYRY